MTFDINGPDAARAAYDGPQHGTFNPANDAAYDGSGGRADAAAHLRVFTAAARLNVAFFIYLLDRLGLYDLFQARIQLKVSSVLQADSVERQRKLCPPGHAARTIDVRDVAFDNRIPVGVGRDDYGFKAVAGAIVLRVDGRGQPDLKGRAARNVCRRGGP